MKSPMNHLWEHSPHCSQILTVLYAHELTICLLLKWPCASLSLKLCNLVPSPLTFSALARFPCSAEKGFHPALQSGSGITGGLLSAYVEADYIKSMDTRMGPEKSLQFSICQSCQPLSQWLRQNGNTCTASTTQPLPCPPPLTGLQLSNQLGTFAFAFIVAMGI